MNFEILEKTPLYRSFSELGKRIYLPDGIFYWTERSKEEADLSGTIGSAYAHRKDFINSSSNDWVPCYLEPISKYVNFPVDNLVPYASIPGLADLRSLWKDWILKKSLVEQTDYSKEYENISNYISTPIVTSGLTNGTFLSCSLFLNSNEVIISPNKRWGNYDNIITRLIGAKIKSFQFFTENGLNIGDLKSILEEVGESQEKIVIILNFPNNPTGYVPNGEEAKNLIIMLKKTQFKLQKPFVVIVDDAYEPFVFNYNAIKRSIFYDLLKINQDIIPVKLDGISKEFLLYGGRIGFITIGLKQHWVNSQAELETLKVELDNKLKGLIRSTVSNCNRFYQSLVINLFKDIGADVITNARKRIVELLRQRYLKINAELSQINNPNFTLDPNSGGFFVFLNLEPSKIRATSFANYLLKNYHLGVIPIENEQEQVNGIRIAYCSIDITQISEVVKRIEDALINYLA